MNETPAPKNPGLARRLMWAFMTSILGALSFFVMQFLLLGGLGSVDEALGEPAATILYYSMSTYPGAVLCLTLSKRWLRRSWSATAAAVTPAYALVGGVPLLLGLGHLAVAKNPLGFTHTWLTFYALPAFGAIGPTVFGGAVWLFARRRQYAF